MGNKPQKGGKTSQTQPIPEQLENQQASINLITYNVWFNESVELEARMKAISQIVLDNKVYLCAFQECTANIMALLKANLFGYKFITQNEQRGMNSRYFTAFAFACDLPDFEIEMTDSSYSPFENSTMGRGMQVAEFIVRSKGEENEINLKINFGTTHLESPVRNMNTFEVRAEQVETAQTILEKVHEGDSEEEEALTLIMGDLNWVPSDEIPMKVLDNWSDLWSEKHGDDPGYTYDGELNGMLKGKPFRTRLDRVLIHEYEKHSNKLNIRMVGTESIKGLKYSPDYIIKPKKKKKKQMYPVLPSDHFGLLIEYVP